MFSSLSHHSEDLTSSPMTCAFGTNVVITTAKFSSRATWVYFQAGRDYVVVDSSRIEGRERKCSSKR